MTFLNTLHYKKLFTHLFKMLAMMLCLCIDIVFFLKKLNRELNQVPRLFVLRQQIGHSCYQAIHE